MNLNLIKKYISILVLFSFFGTGCQKLNMAQKIMAIADSTLSSVVPPLPAPTGLRAITALNSVSLQWDFSSTSTSTRFQVERKLPSDLNFSIIAASISSSFYNDSGLLPATSYLYRVTANDGSKSLAASAVLLVTTANSVPLNRAPTANSGPDISTAVTGVAVPFNGSGSTDPDGDDLSYQWNFGDGTDSSTLVSPAHVFSNAGTYTVTLTISDGKGGSGADTAIITVTNPPAANQAPTARAGADVPNAITAVSVSFNGSGSTDPDNDDLTFLWNFGDGTATTAVPNPTHIYANSGIYTTTLTVSDRRGETNSDTAIVTVTNPPATNQPPVAQAGAATMYTKSVAPYLFSGAASTDPDGDKLTFSWAFSDGGTAAGVDVSHSFPPTGTFVITLTVSDGRGGVASDTINMIVDNIKPSLPSSITTSVTCNSVTLNWTPSTDTGGSGFSDYTIFRGSTLVSQNMTVTSPTFTDTTVQKLTSYIYSINAYDNAGNTSQYSNIIVNTPDCAVATTCATAPTSPNLLSQTCLYSNLATLTIEPTLRPFEPQYPLWTDGAIKKRYIYLPPGTKIDSTDMDGWIYPLGTRIWKEFSLAGQKLETRFMVKIANSAGEPSWKYMAYKWQADGKDAALVSDSGDLNVLGTQHDIPSKSDCKRCHQGRQDFVLGFDAIQLSTAAPGMFSLKNLKDQGLLTVNPTTDSFSIQGTATAKAALGYLHGNCAHCHSASPLADCGFVGLNFRHNLFATQLADENGYVTSIAQSKIVPGDPDNSRIYNRINTNTDSPMPPIGRETIDSVGIDKVRSWILELAPAGPILDATFTADTNPCAIPLGQTLCTTRVTWLTNNSQSVCAYDQFNTNYGCGASGTFQKQVTATTPISLVLREGSSAAQGLTGRLIRSLTLTATPPPAPFYTLTSSNPTCSIPLGGTDCSVNLNVSSNVLDQKYLVYRGRQDNSAIYGTSATNINQSFKLRASPVFNGPEIFNPTIDLILIDNSVKASLNVTINPPPSLSADATLRWDPTTPACAATTSLCSRKLIFASPNARHLCVIKKSFGSAIEIVSEASPLSYGKTINVLIQRDLAITFDLRNINYVNGVPECTGTYLYTIQSSFL